jgi:hypothetical protein
VHKSDGPVCVCVCVCVYCVNFKDDTKLKRSAKGTNRVCACRKVGVAELFLN